MKGIQLYDVEREDNQLRAKRIGVKEFPTILIADDQKVVLETQDIKELKSFFNNLIKKKKTNYKSSSSLFDKALL